MIGAIVYSKAFGQGIIIEETDGYIKVKFTASEKEFPFPRVFDGFLTTEDDYVLSEVERLKQIALQEKARQEEEAKRAEAARQEEIARRRAMQSAGKERTVRISSSSKPSNLAFKCNFCDGGASEECIGFKGPCSDTQINYNIERAKHVWCSTDSPCKKYYDLRITRKELDAEYSCYESRMLLDWKCSAGVFRNGYDAGKPMKLRSVQKNSLVVMTTRDPGMQDFSRYIFGVFLIDEYFEGDERDEGYVTCHSKWRIELNPTEARQILFWRYYYNENAPEKMVFGSGLHRYLSDAEATQILRDIVKVKKDESEKAFAQEFLRHYCELHKIKENEIPEPAGPLKMRNKA